MQNMQYTLANITLATIHSMKLYILKRCINKYHERAEVNVNVQPYYKEL